MAPMAGGARPASRWPGKCALVVAFVLAGCRRQEGFLSLRPGGVDVARGSSLARRAFFPGAADEPEPDAEGVDELLEETKLLRMQTELLASEIRQLREALGGSLAAPAAEAAPAPARPAAPAPAAVAPAAAPPLPPTSTFPTASPAPKAPVQDAELGFTSVKVVSAGHDVGNDAEFFLNDVKIPIYGSASRRGLNVVILDPEQQRVLTAKTYDIWGNPETENKRLASDLDGQPEGRVALVALKDSGMENLDAVAVGALRRYGSTLEGPLGVREGYLLVGVKGSDEEAAEEQFGDGMLMCEVDLPFTVAPPQAVPRYSPPSAKSAPPTPARPRSPPPAAPVSSGGPRAAAPAEKPKLEVDPKGTVTYKEGGEGGQSWEEVVFMLGELEAKIRARRLAGADQGGPP